MVTTVPHFSSTASRTQIFGCWRLCLAGALIAVVLLNSADRAGANSGEGENKENKECTDPQGGHGVDVKLVTYTIHLAKAFLRVKNHAVSTVLEGDDDQIKPLETEIESAESSHPTGFEEKMAGTLLHYISLFEGHFQHLQTTVERLPIQVKHRNPLEHCLTSKKDLESIQSDLKKLGHPKQAHVDENFAPKLFKRLHGVA